MNRTPFAAAVILAGLAGATAAPPPKDAKPLPPPTPEQWKQSEENLKQIGLALHNYHDANGFLPTNTPGTDGKKLLSWRVHILPFVEEDKLYREFKLDEAWDSDHNKKLVGRLPKVFAPVRVTAKAGETFYRGFDGPGTVFEKGQRMRLAAITDGTSNTAAVVEAGEPVIWTKPEDVPFDPAKDLPKLGGLFDGAFNMLICDGSVRRVRKDFDPATMKLVIQRADGQVVDVESLRPRD